MLIDFVTFDSFARMLITNNSEAVHNNHWKSQYYICNICQIKYDLIIHMEDDENAKNRIMQTLNLSPLPSKENYYKNNRKGFKF